MRKWLRRVLLAVGGLACLAAIAGYGLYRGVQYVPEFYEQAVQAEPTRQKAASEQMLKRTAELASDLKRSGPWQATFTAEQVNGWLAVDLVKNHAGLLPGTISDPRVEITPEQVTVACRYREGRINTVLSLSLDVYLEGPNVIAIRVRKARAGALPLPLNDVLKQIGQTTGRLEWRIEWRQADGDPVAVVTIPPPRDKRQKPVELDTLRLGNGEVSLAGSTKSR